MKKILEMLRANLNAQITALASATGKEAETLRASLQQQLTSLGELDKLTEADGAAVVAPALAFLQRQQEHATQLFNDLQATRAQLATTTAQLNELNGKVTSGDLVPKDKLAERCELARQEGVEACQPEIGNLRKQVVAGLPVPPDNVLKLPAAEFASLVEDARANLTTATAKGLALDGKGRTFLTRALWLKKDAFATELASLESDGLLGGARRDPLLGGKDDPEAPAKRNGVGMC